MAPDCHHLHLGVDGITHRGLVPQFAVVDGLSDQQPRPMAAIERFFRTLKEQLLWIRRFRDLEDLRAALFEFRDRYNHNWIAERVNYRTPVQARRDFSLERKLAA